MFIRHTTVGSWGDVGRMKGFIFFHPFPFATPMWTPLPATAKRRSPFSSPPATGWKSCLAALALGTLGALPAAAQLNYPTTVQTATTGNQPGLYRVIESWTPLSTGSTPITFANLDDANSSELTLGFNFPYIGGNFNRIIVNTNGYVKVGLAGMAAPTAFLYGSNPTTLNPNGIFAATAPQDVNLIAPFSHDLDGTARAAISGVTIASPTATYRFFTNGDSAIIEWNNVHDFDYSSIFGADVVETQYATFSFQLKLFPSGLVKFVYGPATANTAGADFGKTAGAGLKGLNPGQIYRLVKSSAAATLWNAATASTAAAGTSFGFRKNRLPQDNSASTQLPAGQAFTYRLTPNNTATFNDRSVRLYTLGQIPLNGGNPHTYRVRITNQTNAVLPASGNVDVSITTGPNVTASPITASIPSIPAGSSVVLDLPPYTLTAATTAQNVNAVIPADNVATNNTDSYSQAVTDYSFAYGTPSVPSAGGVGFNAASPTFVGEFIARFTATTTATLNQARVDFQGINTTDPADGPDPYRLVVYDDNGPGGTPGTLLYLSDELLTPSDPAVAGQSYTALIPILPTVTLTGGGDFFIGVRQIGPNNVGFSYESESPIRDRAFYYRSSNTGVPTTPFLDFQVAGSPFRFSIAADLQDPSPAAPNCAVLSAPANNATNVPVNGQISFSSGGGNPSGFDVYLSTNQTNVQNEAAAALVSSNQQNITYTFSPALAYSTTYYYKVVARNSGGTATGCAVRSFTTPPPPPANDACAAAQVLSVQPNGMCTTTSGTTAGATEDAIVDPTCSGGAIRDVWYSFNTGGSSSVVLQVALGTATAIGAQLFTTCGSAPIACTTNATTTNFGYSGLALNTVYRVRIFTNATSQTPGSFTICAMLPPDLIVNSAISTSGPYNNVIINAGGTLTLNGNLAANDLTVNDGGRLVAGTFLVTGDAFRVLAGGTLDVGTSDGITRLGTVSAPTGNIRSLTLRTYSDDATYRFSSTLNGVTGNGLPATVRGIETGNTAFVTLSNNLSVRELVRVGTADLALGSRSLTLLSNAARTAMVHNASTGVVSGTARVMRYIASPGAPVTYRHLSSPITTNNTIADFNSAPGYFSFTTQANPAYNNPVTRATLPAASYPNVFFFNESAAASANDFLEGYRSPNATSDATVAGRGYAVYMRPTTIDFNGALRNGNVAVTVTNNGPTPDGAGWNLIGNPYPSPMDWDLVTAGSLSTAGLSGAMYVYSSATDNYQPYTNGMGPTGPEIAMGQGFWVQRTSAGSGTFTMTNASRPTTYANPTFQRRTETRPLLVMSVAPAGATTQPVDQAYVYFEQGATDGGADFIFDAQKLVSAAARATLYTRAQGTKMAINGLPALTGAEVTVPLVAEVRTSGTYVLSADRLINIPAGMEAVLIDALTGTTQNLSTHPTYTFQATAGNTTPRFTVVFRTSGVTGVAADQALASQLDVYPNPVSNATVRVALGGLTTERNVTVTILSPLGQVVSRTEVAVANGAMTTELNTRSLARGLYTVRVQTGGRSATRTLVVE